MGCVYALSVWVVCMGCVHGLCIWLVYMACARGVRAESNRSRDDPDGVFKSSEHIKLENDDRVARLPQKEVRFHNWGLPSFVLCDRLHHQSSPAPLSSCVPCRSSTKKRTKVRTPSPCSRQTRKHRAQQKAGVPSAFSPSSIMILFPECHAIALPP